VAATSAISWIGSDTTRAVTVLQAVRQQDKQSVWRKTPATAARSNQLVVYLHKGTLDPLLSNPQTLPKPKNHGVQQGDGKIYQSVRQAERPGSKQRRNYSYETKPNYYEDGKYQDSRRRQQIPGHPGITVKKGQPGIKQDTGSKQQTGGQQAKI
jgi:hypothetical protein